MKFKAPGRKKKNKNNEEEVAAALAETEEKPADEAPPPAAETPAAAETPTAAETPVAETPAEAPVEDPVADAPAAGETPISEVGAAATEAETPATEAETPTKEPEAAAEEAAPDISPGPEPEAEPQPAPEPVPAPDEVAVKEPESPVEEAPQQDPVSDAPAPVPDLNVDINGAEEGSDDLVSPTDGPEVSVELPPIPPLKGLLKKGPYLSANASPKTAKTLKKQKWVEQFCRLDPALFQIFCCDKNRAKLYDADAPVETDGKCMFFHINSYTVAEAGVEEEGAKIKDYTFKITGLNAGETNSLSMSCSSAEDRDKWVKSINRTVNRITIDKARVGDHTKLRQMLTGQEAEISILEEELEKMAVVATECSGRCFLAEEKLALKEAECNDVSSKLTMANVEIASLRSQLAIMEERTKNLNMLADDVNGVSPEEVEAARDQMSKERGERLRAIQLELGGDQDYLENYKKYLNLKRDAVLQRHGSTFSVSSMGVQKSPLTPSAPTA